jgi:hypothetical protein
MRPVSPGQEESLLTERPVAGDDVLRIAAEGQACCGRFRQARRRFGRGTNTMTLGSRSRRSPLTHDKGKPVTPKGAKPGLRATLASLLRNWSSISCFSGIGCPTGSSSGSEARVHLILSSTLR